MTLKTAIKTDSPTPDVTIRPAAKAWLASVSSLTATIFALSWHVPVLPYVLTIVALVFLYLALVAEGIFERSSDGS